MSGEAPGMDKEFSILIVDDEEEVLDALEFTLKRAKTFRCRIQKAANPQDALPLLAKEEFDLVLADYRMPNMTGVELLRRVKEKHPRTVRALITGYSDVEIAMEAMEHAKIHYYVQKPWNNEELRLTVYEALKRDWQA
ncbi:MAG: response regulator [Methanobacteriota archaeon]